MRSRACCWVLRSLLLCAKARHALTQIQPDCRWRWRKGGFVALDGGGQIVLPGQLLSLLRQCGGWLTPGLRLSRMVAGYWAAVTASVGSSGVGADHSSSASRKNGNEKRRIADS